jgi:hypothetical protein
MEEGTEVSQSEETPPVEAGNARAHGGVRAGAERTVPTKALALQEDVSVCGKAGLWFQKFAPMSTVS